MADAITIKALQDASLDAKSLEEVVNGDEVKQVTTRKGESYPSVKKAINTMFENGGLPATPFATKALMTASSITDGAYATVTDDSILENNGLYIKESGVWKKSRYSPLNAISVDKILVGDLIVPSTKKEDSIDVKLSSYSELLDGYYVPSRDNVLIAATGSATAVYVIPTGSVLIHAMYLNTEAYFAFRDANGGLLGNSLASNINIKIPSNAVDVVVTIKWATPSINQDLANNGIVFIKGVADKRGDSNYVKKDALGYYKPVAGNRNIFKMLDLPDYSDTYTISNRVYTSNPILLKDTFVGSAGIFAVGSIAITALIAIPYGTKTIKINLKHLARFTLLTSTHSPTGVFGLSSVKAITVPTNARYIAITVRDTLGISVDLNVGNIVFNADEPNYFISKDEVGELISQSSVDDLGKIMLAKNQYMVDGFNFRLYPDSLFSGYNPSSNFNIEILGTPNTKNYGRSSLVSTAGIIEVTAFDLKHEVIDKKTTTVHKKPMPTKIDKVFSSSNKLQVLFIGDSLFHANKNKIGEEWLRMLNTDSAGSTSGNLVYTPAYNLGSGNIELVGRYGDADIKFEIGNKLVTMMRGADSTLTTAGNPFYDVDSSEANTLGDDGWNKRVDIAKYLQSVCGTGKHPSYIYIACGVNDIIGYGWDVESLGTIRIMMQKILFRLKAACDAIAGGDSGVQIMLVNHQFYPLFVGNYKYFSNALQRKIWTQHYENYENMVSTAQDNGVPMSSFVRFVDCASSFDAEHGYTYTPVTINPRSTITTLSAVDPVHIGTLGSLMYADALLRDFLYHECS